MEKKTGLLEDYVTYLKSKELSYASMRNYMNFLKIFLDLVEQEGTITQEIINLYLMEHPSLDSRASIRHFLDLTNLDNEFKIPKMTGRKKKEKRKPLTLDIAKVMRTWLYHNKNYRYAVMFDITFEAGLRRHETMGIRLEDFYWEEWAKDKTKPCRLKIRGKNKKDRIVVLSPKTMKHIVNYLKEHPEIIDKLFPFHYSIWANKFKDCVKATQTYNFTLHDLRRARATIWMQNDVNLYRIKNRLGHSDISTTMLYISPDEEKELESWESEY